MINILKTIHQLKTEWDALQPIAKKDEVRLWEKLRLEWNYNSNHIEGNTMTYGDTKLLFLLGDNFKAQNNSLKDVNEMRAHDTAIINIKEWAKDKSFIFTEQRIRNLNKLILVKPFWADAVTPNGQKTRRLITPGEYKKYPNHVVLKSGEIFKYAEPNEVIPEMEKLINWYRNDEETHPLIKAAFLHYKFVCIHPFDDGNGRVSRLIMNYHLMKSGYPPVIIKSADKNNYLYALNQADAGNTDAFVQYIGEQLIWSLNLAISAAKGNSLEEKDDLYKEIEVWKKNIKSGIPSSPKRRDDIVGDLYNSSFIKLFNSVSSKTETFKDLFDEHLPKKITFTTINGQKKVPRYYLDLSKSNNEEDSVQNIQYESKFQTLIVSSTPNRDFNPTIWITINLNIFQYEIKSNFLKTEYKKYYSEELSETEIEAITKEVTENLYNHIKAKTDI